jgi:hypothetical protein
MAVHFFNVKDFHHSGAYAFTPLDKIRDWSVTAVV